MPKTTSVAPELQMLGFRVTHTVEGRASVADLFRPRNRCGIYVLHLSEDEYYVGQSVNIVRRYTQHRRTYHDIRRLSFKPVRAAELNREEMSVIAALRQNHYRVTNIRGTDNPSLIPDFDDVMPPGEQDAWRRDLARVDLTGPRIVDEELRQKYRRRYESFTHLPEAQAVISVLREYVRSGIPAIRLGEVSFWSCSCRPSYPNTLWTIYSRINIYWQEVFTASTYQGIPVFSWHLALSPLERAFGPDLSRLKRRHPHVEIDRDAVYKPGGHDQVCILVEGQERALALIHDTDILLAVRQFNLQLMRKGACVYSRSHCLDLADRLVA